MSMAGSSKVGVSGYAKLVIATVLLAIILSITQQFIELNTIWSIGVSGIYMSISYLFIAFILKPFTKEERNMLNRIIKKRYSFGRHRNTAD